MIHQGTIQPAGGARKTSKRVGRGNGSGKGSTAGRGVAGQNSRAGAHFRLGEQTTLLKRMPKKRGFTARNPERFEVVNIEVLAKIVEAGTTEITKEVLVAKGYIRKATSLVKILSNGEISKAVRVSADSISVSARAKIEASGGTIALME